MADAEDLKSSGDFSSCGFDSHPGHQNFRCVFSNLRLRLVDLYPFCTRYFFHACECFLAQQRILRPGPRNIGLELLLARAHPGVVMLLGDANALMAEQNRDALDRNTGQEQLHREGVAETMRNCVARTLRHSGEIE